MTPAERVVVEAALRWIDSLPTRLPDSAAPRLVDLRDATLALKAERADPDALVEQEITWGQVVEGDEIYSPKTQRWYEVTRAVHAGGEPGKSLINAKGIPKGLKPNSADPVTVRRGATGNAVDMFASVIWSA